MLAEHAYTEHTKTVYGKRLWQGSHPDEEGKRTKECQVNCTTKNGEQGQPAHARVLMICKGAGDL